MKIEVESETGNKMLPRRPVSQKKTARVVSRNITSKHIFVENRNCIFMLNRIAAVGWEKEDLGYVGIAFGKACPKCPQGRKDPSDRRFVVHCVLVLAHTPTLDHSEMWGCDADMTKMVARKGDAHLPYIHGSLVFRASLSTFFFFVQKIPSYIETSTIWSSSMYSAPR